MPAVPWGAQRPAFPAKALAHPEDRGMKLKQLRQLSILVKRLCKAGLLTYPDNQINSNLGRVGLRIKWTQITQHEINACILKRIISPPPESCSWVEALANGQKQTCRYFCSHSWAEPFCDFMNTIEHHAKEHRVTPEQSYWICVYANDQWNVELGAELTDSPFYSALLSADHHILLLDKTSDALTRIWVVFEMYEVSRLKKDTEIWTPLGKVGSPLVSSGPVVNALRNMSAAKAGASNPCDLRQILNRIAGVDEGIGLRILSNSGAKELDKSKAFDHYEAKLIDKHPKNFKDLDNTIRMATISNLCHMDKRRSVVNSISQPTIRCSIDDPARRGITLAQIRCFAYEVRGALEKTAYIDNGESSPTRGMALTWESINMYQVRDYFIRNVFDGGSYSYVEAVAEGPQVPQYFFTFAYSTLFKTVLAAIEWHAEARCVPDTAVYYSFLFGVRQRQDLLRSEEFGDVLDERASSRVITEHVDGMFMILDEEASCITRGHSIYHCTKALECGKTLCLFSGTGGIATTRPFADGSWEVGAFEPSISRAMLSFDVVNIKCSIEKERCQILNALAGIPGEGQPPHHSRHYERFNQRFRKRAAGPALREAGFKNDVAMLERILEACPGIALDSAELQGHHGERAMHVAAAAGSISFMSRLFTFKGDPNSEDTDGETPLHYAALAGQEDSARELLRAGADPDSESFLGETALGIAEANPAYFLGIDTRAVRSVLEESWKWAIDPGILRSKIAEQEVFIREQETCIRMQQKVIDDLRKEVALLKRQEATPSLATFDYDDILS